MPRRTLSDEEYAQRLHQLHAGAMQAASGGEGVDEAARRIRAGEVDLTIDHRLGTDYPAELRSGIHRIHAEVERERARFTASVMRGAIAPEQIPARAEQLALLLRTRLERAIGGGDTNRYLGEPAVLPVGARGEEGLEPG